MFSRRLHKYIILIVDFNILHFYISMWMFTFFFEQLKYEGGPKKSEFIYKKLCTYSYMFKLQSHSKYSQFDMIHLSRHFVHCSKQFLNLLILIPYSGVFGQKLLNTQHGVGKCIPKSPFLQWINTWKSLQKNSLKSQGSLVQQCQLVHWYRWVSKTLTYWGKPVLRGVCPPKNNFRFLGVLPHTLTHLWKVVITSQCKS